jgi:hypothetical protein
VNVVGGTWLAVELCIFFDYRFNLQLTFYRAISPPSLPLFCSHTTRRRRCRRRCWGWAGPPAKVSRSACQFMVRLALLMALLLLAGRA